MGYIYTIRDFKILRCNVSQLDMSFNLMFCSYLLCGYKKVIKKYIERDNCKKKPISLKDNMSHSLKIVIKFVELKSV